MSTTPGREGSNDAVSHKPRFENESEEDQLWHLKASIRSEHPNGIFFIGNDGLVTNEPWALIDIIRKPLTTSGVATPEEHVVQVRRMNGTGGIEEYALGDFMERRLVRPLKKN